MFDTESCQKEMFDIGNNSEQVQQGTSSFPINIIK